MAGQAQAQTTDPLALKRLSLEELMNIEVSTVSRKEELWWSAPAGIDVVTSEEIRRAGVQNLPDALRLATGVHVAQSSALSWAVSLRGMNVLAANKISVTLDGRTLYTPFFSGVEWDAQDTMMEDIDRIEVVRGPVGALWGSYAVNGFIQILTKSAADTQGWLISGGAGTEAPGFVSARYGGKAGKETFYRVYAKYSQTDWTYLPNGKPAGDATDFFQTGFRVDARREADTNLTLQGDYYTNQDLSLAWPNKTDISGFNLLTRWQRTYSADSDLQATAYFDNTYRNIPQSFEERRDTVSANVKYRRPAGRHDLVFGTDVMVSRDKTGTSGFASMDPAQRTVHTIGLYVQDTITLIPDKTKLTLGLRGEHNSFSDYEYQPTIRLAWTPTEKTTLWSAVSRAVRPPVRIDQDLVLKFGQTTFVQATDDFKTEQAIAYELGVRHRPTASLTLDASFFLNRYNDIRSTEPLGTATIPVTFKNSLDADSTGAELTVMYQPFSRLFLKGSYRYLDLTFSKDPGSRDTSNGSAEGNDPRHLVFISAHADLWRHVELDAFLRHVSSLPNPATPAYTAADLRLGWRPSDRWELSVSGRNLFAPLHRELVTTNSLNEEIRPSCTAKVTWRY